MGTSFKAFLQERKSYGDIKTGLELHDTLNPKLWLNNELNEKVADALKRIAQEFIEFLGIPKNSVLDVIITGSNCSYNYSPASDLDLHLIVDEQVACPTCSGSFIEDCFWAKKTVWNNSHNIKIKGYPVELYAQPKNSTLIAAGVYSIQQGTWLKKPSSFYNYSTDDISVKAKAGELMDAIDTAIDMKMSDKSALNELKNRITKLRKAGLDKKSEQSTENLAFKALRNNGYIEKLDKYIKNFEDESLSLP